MATTTEKNPETVETTEQQSKFLATGQLFHALAADPRYRKEVLALIKKASPDTPIPELDMEATLLKSLEEKLKPNNESSKQLMDRLEALERRSIRDKWMEEQALSDAEANEVEELAKKEQIGNGNAAVELWRSRQALGTPRGVRKTPPGTEEYLKKLSAVSPTDGKRLKRIAEDEANRIFSTVRQKVS